MNTTKKTTTILTFVLLAVIIFTVWFFNQNKKSLVVPQTSSQIEIVENQFTEAELFTGSYPVLSGNGLLVTLANDYVSEVVSAFRTEAQNIPTLNEERGPDAPALEYVLEIDANEVVGVNTHSIVLSLYRFTGGANGTAVYKVFTVDSAGNQLTIEQVIKAESQNDFVTAVKNKILDWKVEGESVVFKEEVERLTLASFENFAIDSDAFYIFFDEYEIAPGYVGPIAFKMSLADAQVYLSEMI